MNRTMAILAAVVLLVAVGTGSRAQESRPGPGPGMGWGGSMEGHGHMGGHMGGSSMKGGMMREMGHLEHMMVHNPRAAARVMRFRADMLKAMSEVLQRHAAELETAQ